MSRRRILTVGSRRLRRRLTIQSLEQRHLLSGLPLGADPLDTGEFMLGRVAVTPIFFESVGPDSVVDWTQQEIDGVMQKIRDGMQWWVDLLDSLDTKHTLEFVYDETFVHAPFETPYEPITRTSNSNVLYVGDFLAAQGMDTRLPFDQAVRRFNHQQRVAMDADWAFSIVVVNSNYGDGMFAPGGTFSSAFAYPGGMYMVVPSARPTSTIAHETGHMFWANDEYPGGDPWFDQRGYYNNLNLNAADNPAPDFVQEISIMAGGSYRLSAFQQLVSPESTLAYVGWRDSSGNGIFDVMDVPLHLEGVGRFEAQTQQFHFEGQARAVALPNQNRLGLQNDITLNRISRVEYRFDDGPWLTAAAPDVQVAEISFAVTVPIDAELMEVRVIDAQTGVTSPSIVATRTRPGTTPASITAFAFLDENDNGLVDGGESPLAGLSAMVMMPHGHVLPVRHWLHAEDLAAGQAVTDTEFFELQAVASNTDGRVGVVDTDAGKRFAWYQAHTGQWRPTWNRNDVLILDFDQPTTEFSALISAAQAGAVGRIDAFDDTGELITRDTSERLDSGQARLLRVQDQQKRISQVRIFGHMSTEIHVSGLGLGPNLQANADALGLLRLENLPDGVYDVQFQPLLTIHAVPEIQTVEIVDGRSTPLEVPILSVPSPWRNSDLPADVNGDGNVQAIDALMIINYLNRNGAGVLPRSDDIPVFVDTNGDGRITPADALFVINALNRLSRPSMPAGVQGESAIQINSALGSETSETATIERERHAPWSSQISSAHAAMNDHPQQRDRLVESVIFSDRNDFGPEESENPLDQELPIFLELFDAEVL